MRLCFDRGTLVLHDPPPGFQPPLWFQWDGRVDRWRAQAYHYRAIVEQLKQTGVGYDNHAPAYRTLTLARRLTQVPHAFQAEAIVAWKTAGCRGVVVLPTGAGKSYVGQMAIETVRRSTLVVVPTIDLLSQWYDLLCAAFGEPVGLLGGGYYEVHELTVATYESAYTHMDRLGNRWGMVIFDECHHLPGEMYSHAAEMCLAPYRLGLTATPERTDGRHVLLDALIGPQVYTKGIKELAGDYLADYVIERITVTLTPEEQEEYRRARSTFTNFLIDHGIVLDGLAGWHRFVRESALSRTGRQALLAHQRSKKLALATSAKLRTLDYLLKKHARERVLIFTSDNDTVYAISAAFLIPAITHQTPAKERREILQGFHRGDYLALVTSKVLNEGINVPEASVAVILSGSGSTREHVQRLGRVLRKREGKQAILYEVVTAGTVEEGISRRRRQHEAYQ
ncbi:MAG: DEAD/DEAH box helicase family protein [Candidatus Binatia bacterium]|nr:DEAD/DEAH box helicase family protein [Candidatus Binatia bacterium]